MDAAETKLFRDAQTWDYLQRHCLPQVVQRRRKLRAWMAQCDASDGVYSLALALTELLGDSLGQVTLYATDCNEQSLAATRAGTFSPGAFSNVTTASRDRCFTPLPDGRYKIRDKLRDCVVCGRHQLFEDAPLSQLDLLICERFPAELDAAQKSSCSGASTGRCVPRVFWCCRQRPRLASRRCRFRR